MLTDELIATSARTRRIAGAEQVEPFCLAAGKWLAGLRALVDNPGVLPLRASRAVQGAGRVTRSGGDRQCHQPFELADFLAKTARARAAAGRLQPLAAAAKVRCPGRLVPTLTSLASECATQGRRLAAGAGYARPSQGRGSNWNGVVHRWEADGRRAFCLQPACAHHGRSGWAHGVCKRTFNELRVGGAPSTWGGDRRL